MKTLTMRCAFAVAALAVAAVSASAQTYKADVPVAFRAGDKLMAAGSYQFRAVTSATGQKFVTVRNLATNRAAVLMATPGNDAPKTWRAAGNAKISFECLGSTCALRQMWDGRDVSTYSFPGLKVRSADTERMASLTVSLTKGD